MTKVDDIETRSKAVQLLSRMFAAKGSSLAANYRPLFATLLKRFNDKEVQIRLFMVAFAKLYLINQKIGVSDVDGLQVQDLVHIE